MEPAKRKPAGRRSNFCFANVGSPGGMAKTPTKGAAWKTAELIPHLGKAKASKQDAETNNHVFAQMMENALLNGHIKT